MIKPSMFSSTSVQLKDKINKKRSESGPDSSLTGGGAAAAESRPRPTTTKKKKQQRKRKCTLCSNKENFQEEMLRMGIFIPERDASWELEENAYSELLEVYERCDALVCLCSDGPTHSAKSGPSLPVTASSSEDLLQALAPQLRPLSVQVEVSGYQALLSGLDLVRRPDFDPALSLSVRFLDEEKTTFPSSLRDGGTARQYFLKLLVQQIQDSVVFEGPDGSKNLALDSQEAESLDSLRDAMVSSREFLEVAGCDRPIGSLEERGALVEDLVGFTLITRMQLPLQRFREGLQTLGVFDQVQLFPAEFRNVFCEATARLSAQLLAELFTVNWSEQTEKLNKETPVVTFWRHFLLECEGIQTVSMTTDLRSLKQLLQLNCLMSPLLFYPLSSPPFSSPPGEREWEYGGLFPQSEPSSKLLLLPVTSSYGAFKSSMEQAVFDQYLNFITLEDDMFILCHQSKELISYHAINRADIQDTDMEAIMDTIVDSLFCFFVTLVEIEEEASVHLFHFEYLYLFNELNLSC
ncbi:hypothetical protein F2P81_002937 [Scophthalmus maximus]|uniref:HECT domain-containing protein n=1 Tax=Scophthalmus maximus TaxID=52904 RepID=A0A6A4TG22_SCOMX|nr:hypothetical protein F2P81_002937 [Scophthalmus maximus]